MYVQRLFIYSRTSSASFVNMNGFYLNVSSTSSIYNSNVAASFTVGIQPVRELKGNWGVALVEMFLPSATVLKPKYVLANFIESTVVGESRRQVLRVVYEKEQHIAFSREYYRVTDTILDTLEFELIDSSGSLWDITGETQLRLHFAPWSAV